MRKIFAPEKVYVSKSRISDASRGVFAKSDIKKGEVVETAPIIEVPRHDMSNLKESVLVTYFFYFGKNKERLAVALGFGSIYNHSDKPNVAYKIKLKEKIIEFTAINDITKDDEITFDYANIKKRENPLWFQA
jgi:SET domain-containing protein